MNGNLVDLDGIDGSNDSVNVTGGGLTIDSVDAEGDLVSTGLVHLQGASNNLAADVSGVGVTFDNDVTADGVAVDQTFDATSGTLLASSTIGKTGGALTLIGDDIDLIGTVTGDSQVTVGDTDTTSINIAANVTGAGVTFAKAVTADGVAVDQTFDALAGTLTASGITKSTTGDLTLGGAAGINLSGNVTGFNDAGDSVIFADAVTANGADQVFDAQDGTLTASGNITKTGDGNLTLGGATAINLSGDVTGFDDAAYSVTFDDDVTADGGVPGTPVDQTFDALGGTLIASGNITKTGDGNLTLGGVTAINLAGDVTGFDDAAYSVTFDDAVTADGGVPGTPVNQTFDALGGTLIASGNITKTGDGNLTLAGDTAINLDGTVDVDAGSLIIEDAFNASGDLIASADATLNAAGILDGAAQRIDAEAGTLWAKSTLDKDTAGNLTLAGGTAINLDGTVDVQDGDLLVEDNATVAAGETLRASGNLIQTEGKTLTGEGDLTLVAIGGTIKATSGPVEINMSNDDKTLRLTQNGLLNMDTFAVTDNGDTTPKDTNLIAEVTGETFTDNYADRWQSIQAKASGNVVLSGDSNIVIGTDEWTDLDSISRKGVYSTDGGVSIKSTSGTVVSAGNTILDDVTISGFANGNDGVSILEGEGNAAIVIHAGTDLVLGSDLTLEANGAYDTGIDERPDVKFFNDGEDIDVAIHTKANNITMDATVSNLVDNTAMVFDAETKVEFGSIFEGSMSSLNSTHGIEVVSRDSGSLTIAKGGDWLPYVNDPDSIKSWFDGDYVLRGGRVLAHVLAFVEAYQPVALTSFDLEEEEDIQYADLEGSLQLLVDEGFIDEENVQTYLDAAYSKMYATDLRPYKAAEKIKNYIPILADEGGTRLANLGALVNKHIASDDAIPSAEQYDSIVAELYSQDVQWAAAKEWLDAVVDTAGILTTEIGQPRDVTIANLTEIYLPEIERATQESVGIFFANYISQSAI